jgi:hypothetical protein
MTFTAPLFLLAAFAAAIPVVLHMINRQRAKELPFSTLRFLKISVQKTRRRKRIHDLLLMLMRASLLLLIAAALSKPAITSLGALWGGAHSAVVVILDNSGSMSMTDQDRVRLDTATAAASQILDQLTDGDQAALLTTCGRMVPGSDQLERTQDKVRENLAKCRMSYERADLPSKLRQAKELLAKSEAPNKQIYIITDMQKISWEGLTGGSDKSTNANKEDAKKPDSTTSPANGESEEQTKKTPIIIVDCNRSPKPNVAVQGVAVEAAVPVAGLPVKATVTLLNSSEVPRQPRVELWIDNAKEASSPELNVPSEGKTKYDFQFAFRTGGLHRGEVRLVGEDGAKFDDRRFFAMEVDQDIPVAIVRAKQHEISYLDDAYYLKSALSPGKSGGWAVRVTSLTADDLLGESLDKFKVIYCVNLPAPSNDAAERLRTFVAGGGNLVWIAGDNTQPAAYNQMNDQAKGQLLPASLTEIREPSPQDNRDSWHISFLDKTYPAFKHLVEPTSLYESVLVYKHLGMKVDQATRVLAGLDDGEPLLAMRNVEKGRVLLYGSTVHVNWSNLPLRPVFLPMMARLTFELAGIEQKYHNLIAGQPLTLQLPDQNSPGGVELMPPGGEMLRLKTEGITGQTGQTFSFPHTNEIGIYTLRLLNSLKPTATAYSVNFDPDEPDGVKSDAKTLREALAPSPVHFADNPDDLTNTFALLREGRSLWGTFLTLVLIVLVFETLVSNRLSPKQEGHSDDLPPPGLRRLAKNKN